MKPLQQRIESLRWVLEDQRQRIAAGPKFKQNRDDHPISYTMRCLEWTEAAKAFYDFGMKQLAALEKEMESKKIR